MNPKRKHTDSPQNPLQKLLYNLLFVRQFEFQTSVPAEICADRLTYLHKQTQGGFYRRKTRYNVDIHEDGFGAYDFDMRTKDRGMYTIAQAVGEVIPQGMETTIRGEVRFGAVYFFLVGISVLWTLFIMENMFFALPLFMTVLFLLSPLYTFWYMYKLRNKLLQEIETAVRPRYFEDRTARLSKRGQQMDDGLDMLLADETDQAYYDNQKS